MENDRVNVLAQKWPMVRYMNFRFVLPRIYINFDIQTKFEVNQTQIGHSISKKLQKFTKVAIYLKSPFCPSVIHQKAYSSYIFQ